MVLFFIGFIVEFRFYSESYELHEIRSTSCLARIFMKDEVSANLDS